VFTGCNKRQGCAAVCNAASSGPTTDANEMNSPARPKRRLYPLREPAIYLPILAAAFVAWFAPLNTLDLIPQLKVLTAFIRGAFPAMGAYVSKSAFPQVTELYFALMALHAVVHIPFCYLDCKAQWPLWQANWHRSLGARVVALVVVFLVCPALAIFMFWFNPGFDLAWMPLNTERWALGAFGWILAGAGIVNIAMPSASWLWAFLTGQIWPGPKSANHGAGPRSPDRR
jgi:hypothetical protein